MPSNIEVKARVNSAEKFDELDAVARKLCSSEPEILEQADTFFKVPNGRLKLRTEVGKPSRLISYQRSDEPGPCLSEYQITPVQDPASMIEVLDKSCGIRVEVVKTRRLYIYKCPESNLQARIHLDEVADLGRFLEFEVLHLT